MFSLALFLSGGGLFVSPRPAVSQTAADTSDTKRLRLLMVGLGQDMFRINTGIWHEDYDLTREGATSIANHPRIPPDQIAKIKKALREDFQNFVRFDKSVHGTATELVSAAEARNGSADRASRRLRGVPYGLPRAPTTCADARRIGPTMRGFHFYCSKYRLPHGLPNLVRSPLSEEP
jgi:hypothetical protein